MTDQELLNRALGILHRLATENKGWGWFGFLRRISRRWYYADEPHDGEMRRGMVRRLQQELQDRGVI